MLTTKLRPTMELFPMRGICASVMLTTATPSSPAVMLPKSPACL